MKIKVPFVDLKAQYKSTKKEILHEIEAFCENASFVLSPFVKKFEDNFSQYLGSKYCITLNSGTAADQMSIQALIQPGDAIVTGVPAMVGA